MRGLVGITPPHVVPVTHQNLDFQRALFCAQLYEARVGCSFCWYCLTCCLSLIKLFFLCDVTKVLRNHNPFLIHDLSPGCNKSITTGATCGTGTTFPYGSPEFNPVISGVRVVRSLVFCVMFCRSLSVLLFFFGCPLHCLSVFDLRPRITPVGIFKPFSSLRSRWPWPILAIQFIHSCVLPQNELNYLSFHCLTLNVPDESYSRNASWAQHKTSMCFIVQ
jgi:hypothetical protein